jgi:aminopeptidase N
MKFIPIISLTLCVWSSTCISFQAPALQKTRLPFSGSSTVHRQLARSQAQADTGLAVADSNIDVTYYGLNLQIFPSPALPSSTYLKGSVIIKAISLVSDLRKIRLNLMRSAMKIDSVTLSSKKVGFVQDSSSFAITLDRPYRAGQAVSAEITYESRELPNWFGALNFGSHGKGIPLIWSIGEPPATPRYWWPCKDHPSDKADSADIIVTVDSGLTVCSQGRLVSVRDNGDRTVTYHWHEQYPIATYLVSIAISNYASFKEYFHYSMTDSMQILNYALPEHLNEAKTSWSGALEGLKIFSDLFGLYPFVKEKYGHVEAVGGMENQTLTSISILHFDSGTVIHELAHQWFGDMITCRTWSDLWLNEGFATYCEALFAEKKFGPDQYRNEMRRDITSALTARGSVLIADTNDVAQLFDGARVYRKGAVVLHMLRHVLGDSVFFSAMYRYANDPTIKYGSASTQDFQRVCENTSGRNLDYFFKEWIYGEGYPRYMFRWVSSMIAGGSTANVTLGQTTDSNDPKFFTMPVDIKFSTPGWDTTVTVFNDSQSQTFSIQLPRKPESVLIDPGDWILKVIGK